MHAQVHRPGKRAACRDVQVIGNGVAGSHSLAVVGSRDGESGCDRGVSIGDRRSRAERDYIARCGRREASDVTRRVVIRIAVNGRTEFLNYRSPEIGIPRNVIAGCGNTIRAKAAVIRRPKFSVQALAPYLVSRRIQGPLVSRAKAAEIHRASGIDAVVWAGIIELDGNGKVEGIHQADVIVVAGWARTQGPLRKCGVPRPGMRAIQNAAAVSGRAGSLAGTIKGAVPASPDSSRRPRVRNGRGCSSTREQFDAP